jgi:chromosome condensin MukBEF ATPase and DNA-binding subunit MukB
MTGKTTARLVLALALTMTALAAHSSCRDDLATLNARLAIGDQKAPNTVAAKKELAKLDDQKGDEIACDNAVARAWTALRKPVPAADDQAAQ